jgi:hypothetical protein
VAGAALVAVALWIVGLDDRVVDASGATHRGRLVESAAAGRVVLRTAEGDRVFDPAAIRSVRAGLPSAFRPLIARPQIAILGLAVHLLAILTVHLKAGFFLPMGYEFTLTLLGATLGLALMGSGKASIDRALEQRRVS